MGNLERLRQADRLISALSRDLERIRRYGTKRVAWVKQHWTGVMREGIAPDPAGRRCFARSRAYRRPAGSGRQWNARHHRCDGVGRNRLRPDPLYHHFLRSFADGLGVIRNFKDLWASVASTALLWIIPSVRGKLFPTVAHLRDRFVLSRLIPGSLAGKPADFIQFIEFGRENSGAHR